MTKDNGRVPDGTGLSQAEPQEGLGPPGFDPSRITALLEAADENCLQPIIRKAADDFYDRVLGTVQDYLMDNLDFNLKSHVSMLRRENERMRAELLEVDKALGNPPIIPDRVTAVQRLETMARRYLELTFAVSQKYEGEDRHETALRYIRERDSDGSPEGGDGEAGSVHDSAGPEGIAQGQRP